MKFLTNTFLKGHNYFHLLYPTHLALCFANSELIKWLIFLFLPPNEAIYGIYVKKFCLKILLLFENFIYAMNMNLHPVLKSDNLMRYTLNFDLFY